MFGPALKLCWYSNRSLTTHEATALVVVAKVGLCMYVSTTAAAGAASTWAISNSVPADAIYGDRSAANE